MFRLMVMDDESHKELFARRFTRFGLWFVLFVALVLTCTVLYCLVAFTPIRTTIPGYPDSHSRNEAVRNALRIDSLETAINRWEFYAENLRRVVDGEQPVNIDSLLRHSGVDSSALMTPAELARRDSMLRKQVAEESQFDLSGEKRDLNLDGRHFFTPLKGAVSKSYDPVLHPYIDITAPSGSLVLAVLDGTVIYDGWSDNAGYTIAIQHQGDLVTIYKHNQKLLKATGDKVSAGTAIGLVGDAEELAGDHLHFEMWYNGSAVDPTKLINF